MKMRQRRKGQHLVCLAYMRIAIRHRQEWIAEVQRRLAYRGPFQG
jgi:hypothetical protein